MGKPDWSWKSAPESTPLTTSRPTLVTFTSWRGLGAARCIRGQLRGRRVKWISRWDCPSGDNGPTFCPHWGRLLGRGGVPIGGGRDCTLQRWGFLVWDMTRGQWGRLGQEKDLSQTVKYSSRGRMVGASREEKRQPILACSWSEK